MPTGSTVHLELPWKARVANIADKPAVPVSTSEVLEALLITGDVDWRANRLMNLLAPAAPQDAATKQYVDAHAGSSTDSVRVAGAQPVALQRDNDIVIVSDGTVWQQAPGHSATAYQYPPATDPGFTPQSNLLFLTSKDPAARPDRLPVRVDFLAGRGATAVRVERRSEIVDGLPRAYHFIVIEMSEGATVGEIQGALNAKVAAQGSEDGIPSDYATWSTDESRGSEAPRPQVRDVDLVDDQAASAWQRTWPNIPLHALAQGTAGGGITALDASGSATGAVLQWTGAQMAWDPLQATHLAGIVPTDHLGTGARTAGFVLAAPAGGDQAVWTANNHDLIHDFNDAVNALIGGHGTVSGAIPAPAAPAKGNLLWWDGAAWSGLAAGGQLDVLQTTGADGTLGWAGRAVPDWTGSGARAFLATNGDASGLEYVSLAASDIKSGRTSLLTPWGSDVDAAGYSLQSLHTLKDRLGDPVLSLSYPQTGSIPGQQDAVNDLADADGRATDELEAITGAEVAHGIEIGAASPLVGKRLVSVDFYMARRTIAGQVWPGNQAGYDAQDMNLRAEIVESVQDAGTAAGIHILETSALVSARPLNVDPTLAGDVRRLRTVEFVFSGRTVLRAGLFVRVVFAAPDNTRQIWIRRERPANAARVPITNTYPYTHWNDSAQGHSGVVVQNRTLKFEASYHPTQRAPSAIIDTASASDQVAIGVDAGASPALTDLVLLSGRRCLLSSYLAVPSLAHPSDLPAGAPHLYAAVPAAVNPDGAALGIYAWQDGQRNNAGRKLDVQILTGLPALGARDGYHIGDLAVNPAEGKIWVNVGNNVWNSAGNAPLYLVPEPTRAQNDWFLQAENTADGGISVHWAQGGGGASFPAAAPEDQNRYLQLSDDDPLTVRWADPQTPWLSDVVAAGHALDNLSALRNTRGEPIAMFDYDTGNDDPAGGVLNGFRAPGSIVGAARATTLMPFNDNARDAHAGGILIGADSPFLGRIMRSITFQLDNYHAAGNSATGTLHAEIRRGPSPQGVAGSRAPLGALVARSADVDIATTWAAGTVAGAPNYAQVRFDFPDGTPALLQDDLVMVFVSGVSADYSAAPAKYIRMPYEFGGAFAASTTLLADFNYNAGNNYVSYTTLPRSTPAVSVTANVRISGLSITAGHPHASIPPLLTARTAAGALIPFDIGSPLDILTAQGEQFLSVNPPDTAADRNVVYNPIVVSAARENGDVPLVPVPGAAQTKHAGFRVLFATDPLYGKRLRTITTKMSRANGVTGMLRCSIYSADKTKRATSAEVNGATALPAATDSQQVSFDFSAASDSDCILREGDYVLWEALADAAAPATSTNTGALRFFALEPYDYDDGNNWGGAATPTLRDAARDANRNPVWHFRDDALTTRPTAYTADRQPDPREEIAYTATVGHHAARIVAGYDAATALPQLAAFAAESIAAPASADFVPLRLGAVQMAAATSVEAGDVPFALDAAGVLSVDAGRSSGAGPPAPVRRYSANANFTLNIDNGAVGASGTLLFTAADANTRTLTIPADATNGQGRTVAYSSSGRIRSLDIPAGATVSVTYYVPDDSTILVTVASFS